MTSQARQPWHLSTSILIVLTIFFFFSPVTIIVSFSFIPRSRSGFKTSDQVQGQGVDAV
jgi:hypothetical protein